MASTQSGSADRWNNSAELERTLMERLEQGTLRIPPYPSVALALRKLVSEENYGLEDVLTIISKDAALVADVLRCANSAFFGRGNITSPRQAVGRVGAQQIMRLALVSGLSGIVRAAGPLAPLRRQAWERSIASSAVCQHLATLRRLPVELASTAGLLHDFGWLIAIGSIEEMLAQDPNAPARSEAFWANTIENCHTQLGLALAARWNLPAVLLEAIGMHHQPDEPSEFAPFIELVAISDRVNDLMQSNPLVSAGQLATIPQLTATECSAIAAMLPQIPELITSFASETNGGPTKSALLGPQSALLDGFQPADLRVMRLGARKSGPYHLIGIGPNGWVMKGHEPLLEKQIVEMEIGQAPTALRLWAKIDLCMSDEKDGWQFECKPFALTGASMQQWTDLVRSLS